jgi:hypothetical protein
MNSIDIYTHWETFNRMIEDPQFDTQTKVAMGGEMIRSLPPEMLCAVSKSSLLAIKDAMKSRLTNLGNTDGTISTEPRHSTPETPSKVRKPRRTSNT